MRRRNFIAGTGGEPIRLAETEQHAAIGLRQTHRRTSRVGRSNRRQLDRTGISCPLTAIQCHYRDRSERNHV
jgi:hypothetical protein